MPAPRLHPNLPKVYREKVAALTSVLGREAVVLVPEDGDLRVEIRGELAAILSLASAGHGARTASAGAEAGALKVVAGRGFEPLTFRL